MLNTFQVLVNAIIPRTPGLAYEYGVVQYYGALDLHVEEYVIFNLNSLEIPFAQPTADLLDHVAYYYVNLESFNLLYALVLLRQLQINLSNLPVPFKDNPLFVIQIANSLYQYTLMGYYSEWAGYGNTRLAEPNARILEYYPISWEQIGYPGPSLGYRVLSTYTFS